MTWSMSITTLILTLLRRVIFFNFGLGKDKIPFISERNPSKVGLRCVGTDIELISEEKARSLKPKVMLVLPWYFKEEIVKRG